MKETASSFFKQVQARICEEIEAIDDKGKFCADNWTREDLDGSHGGGGLTRVLSGDVFESAGVNFSEVSGNLPQEMSEKLVILIKKVRF